MNIFIVIALSLLLLFSLICTVGVVYACYAITHVVRVVNGLSDMKNEVINLTNSGTATFKKVAKWFSQIDADDIG